MLRIHDTIAELFKCLRQEITILFTLITSAFSKCAVLQEHIPCAWTASDSAAPSARARHRTRMLVAVARASSPGNTNFTHTYQSLCKRNTGSEHCCGMQMMVHTAHCAQVPWTWALTAACRGNWRGLLRRSDHLARRAAHTGSTASSAEASD